MSILAEICRKKLAHISEQKAIISEKELEESIKKLEPPRGFLSAIKKEKPRINIIAEIKKASPSAGIIRKDFDPAAIARIYENSSATCISVLTDTPYFQGSDKDLQAVKQATSIPILRKDFMLDPYQITESRAIGADAVLLIMAALELDQARELEEKAMSFDIDILVEVHNEEELERALKLKTRLIGINNRDLNSLKVDLATTEKLAKKIPESHTIICESGIKTRDDIKRMLRCGVDGFLIGESLMREQDIGKALENLVFIDTP